MPCPWISCSKFAFLCRHWKVLDLSSLVNLWKLFVPIFYVTVFIVEMIYTWLSIHFILLENFSHMLCQYVNCYRTRKLLITKVSSPYILYVRFLIYPWCTFFSKFYHLFASLILSNGFVVRIFHQVCFFCVLLNAVQVTQKKKCVFLLLYLIENKKFFFFFHIFSSFFVYNYYCYSIAVKICLEVWQPRKATH